MSSSLGPGIVAIGIVVVLVGILISVGGLHWFGRLPGDIRITRESYRFYFPITSGLVVSAVLTLVLRLARRFFR